MDLEPRVFVVDDDSMVLRAVERLLRSSGFTVADVLLAEEPSLNGSRTTARRAWYSTCGCLN